MIKLPSRNYWAAPKQERHQLVLFSPSLDEMIGAADPLRQLDAIFGALDWSSYEAAYDGFRGQPPIHPRHLASCIFYGILKGIRSSRRLEEATRVRIDFMWLLNGQTIDHTTVNRFRTRFAEALKDTFRQVNREGLKRLGDELTDLVVDGTRMRANSDRHGARTAAWLEQRLATLQASVEAALLEMAAQDMKDDPDLSSAEEIQDRLDGLRKEMEKYENALAVARERDETKREKEGKNAKPVRVPVTDPDSAIIPNKEGGYAPNYTPVVAVNSASGMIVETTVRADNSEAVTVPQFLQSVETKHGLTPGRVLCDSGFASGDNQAELAKKGIPLYTKVDCAVPETHPARRDDPSQPLSPEQIAQLPRVKTTGKLGRDAFLFDRELNLYWCPMGRQLLPSHRLSNKTSDGRTPYQEYQCRNCENCPLATDCLSRDAKHRMVRRDCHEDERENTARRMSTKEGRKIYRQRAPVIEGTFGTIKGSMGIRGFLLRGLEKVNTEWLWICTAYNLKKLMRLLAGHRCPQPPAANAGLLAPFMPNTIHGTCLSYRINRNTGNWAECHELPCAA
jgi:transposase